MSASGVPKQHKAMVYDQPGTMSVKLETVDTPTPGAGEVLLQMTHSGVCHSDYAVMTNAWKWLPYPTQAGQVGGHEGVGKVVAFGPGAENSGLKIGDRAGIKWIAGTCGNCLPCQAGADAICSEAKISGYYTPGTYQQYTLAPANYVTPIPDGLSSELAAPLLCGGVTVYAALKKLNAKPGDAVVISGAGGGLGHLGLQIGARAMGLKMIGVDAGNKEELARLCGAEAFFDITKYSRDKEGSDKLAADVKAATPEGLGAAGVVVCTAANAAYAQAMDFLRFRGTMVCVGIPEGEPVVIAGADPSSMVILEKQIVGSAVGNRQDAIETLELASRGLLKTEYSVEPMGKLSQVFERMERGEVHGRVVVDLAQA